MTPTPPDRSLLRSEVKVRALDATNLGLDVVAPTRTESIEEPLVVAIAEDDPYLTDVRSLLADGYAGVIFTGPPGTSKSWYASQIAARLVDLDAKRVRAIQFHSSYQYEDFVEGYVPHSGGFVLKDKHLLEMCDIARKAYGKLCVLVIDELSRCDPGRVFGEALTYIEMTKREQPFRLASGKVVSIPSNLVILATMNPLDRGVDEVDIALERRFAKILMEPNSTILRQFLTANNMDEDLQEKVVRFFEGLQRNPNPYSKIGHTYFYAVSDEDSLRRLWRHQLRFQLEKAFRLDTEGFRTIESSWNRVVLPAADLGATPAEMTSEGTLTATSDNDEPNHSRSDGESVG